MYNEKMKLLREEKNLKQKDLAVILDVSQQTISKYEKAIREPDLKFMKKFADYFGVSLDYLFNDDFTSDNINQDKQDIEQMLSANEQRMLKIYRSLLPAEQNTLIEIAQTLSRMSSEK